MHAAIFGNVAAIIQKLYANRVRYHSRANEIKQFIRVHRIEQDLANRLEDYFHTTWSLSGGVDTSEVRMHGKRKMGYSRPTGVKYHKILNRRPRLILIQRTLLSGGEWLLLEEIFFQTSLDLAIKTA